MLTFLLKALVKLIISTIVLNSRDRHEKNMASHFFAPPQHASQYTLPEKTHRIHWLLYDNNIPSLNSVKILTVRSVGNFKNFRTYQYLV